MLSTSWGHIFVRLDSILWLVLTQGEGEDSAEHSSGGSEIAP